MQKYKIFKLFILILNYSLYGCVADHAGPAEPKHENQSEQNMKAIEVGDKAPLFTLPDQNGKMFNLDDHLGRKTLKSYQTNLISQVQILHRNFYLHPEDQLQSSHERHLK